MSVFRERCAYPFPFGGEIFEHFWKGAPEMYPRFQISKYATDCVGVLWQRVIDVLKLNVDTAEWPFLRNVLVEDVDQLDSVKQLLLEIHSPRPHPYQLNNDDLAEMIFYAKKLQSRGFAVFNYRQSNDCCKQFAAMMPSGVREKCCQQTSYINQRFIRPTPDKQLSI